jgi:uncharacterized membrane protein (DUF485 family)
MEAYKGNKGENKKMSRDQGTLNSLKGINYSEVAKSDKFKHLLQLKKRFILSYSIFFILFYFSLPIMTSYTTVLNQPAVGAITWAWVFAFAQFIMTWSLCIIYTKKASKFDQMVEEIKDEHK